MLLEVKDLCVSYGAIKALRGVSFCVETGEIITLIGSNGAGKNRRPAFDSSAGGSADFCKSFRL